MSFFPKLGKKYNQPQQQNTKHQRNSTLKPTEKYYLKDSQLTDRISSGNYINERNSKSQSQINLQISASNNNLNNKNNINSNQFNINESNNQHFISENNETNVSESLILNNHNNYARSLFQTYNVSSKNKSKKLNLINHQEKEKDNKEKEIQYQTQLGKTIIFTPGNKNPNQEKLFQRNSSQKIMHLNTRTEMYKVEKNLKSELANEMEKQNSKLREDIKNRDSIISQLELQVKELQNQNQNLQQNILNLDKSKSNQIDNQKQQDQIQLITKLKIENKHISSMKSNLEIKLKNAEKESNTYLNNCKFIQEKLEKTQLELEKVKQEYNDSEKKRKNSILNNSKQLKSAKSQELDNILDLQKENQQLKYQVQLLNENIKIIKDEINIFYDIKPTRQELLQQIDENDETIGNLNQKLEELQAQNNLKISEIENLKLNDNTNKIQYEEKLKENQKDKQLLKEDINNLINHMESVKESFQEKQNNLHQNIQDLQQKQDQLQSNLKCSLCENILENPVTVIPCGHSYCKNKCKSGYKGQCKQCGPSTKIEAVYRNELYDEMIKMQATVNEINSKLNNIYQLPEIFQNLQNLKQNQNNQIQEEEQNINNEQNTHNKEQNTNSEQTQKLILSPRNITINFSENAIQEEEEVEKQGNI